jgi:transcription initiation factor TFIIIB Brf1 subunit/transcription initiation factor TFIIB
MNKINKSNKNVKNEKDEKSEKNMKREKKEKREKDERKKEKYEKKIEKKEDYYDENPDINMDYEEYDEKEEEEKDSDKTNCKHTKVSGNICLSCGIELTNISEQQEWRYFGNSDNRYNNDPSRIRITKTIDKNILKELDKYSLSDYIKHESNSLYLKIVNKNEILRGSSRLGLIFAVVYTCYKNSTTPKTSDEINELFKLDKKIISEGLKTLKLKLREKNVKLSIHRKPPGTTTLSKEHLFISSIMDKLNSNKQNKEEVYKLYDKIKNRHSSFNSSKPHSVACSLVYYYCKKNKYDITSLEFSKLVGLSDITINKLVKIIDSVLKTNYC